jgi:four helix bundle protein
MAVTMQDYRNLDVWKRAMDLAEACYVITENFPRREHYGLASQLPRSAVSIPSNIAEGCGRDSPREFARFLRIAYGSGCEVGTQIELARRAGLGHRAALDSVASETERIRRMLTGLLAKLNRGP